MILAALEVSLLVNRARLALRGREREQVIIGRHEDRFWPLSHRRLSKQMTPMFLAFFTFSLFQYAIRISEFKQGTGEAVDNEFRNLTRDVAMVVRHIRLDANIFW